MKVNLGKFYKSGSRKENVQVERFDTWNLDHTLALIILPCLVQLKETKHGVPNEFAEVGGEDYIDQLCFDFYSETHNTAFDMGVQRWDEVLDKMIWSFEQLIKDDFDKLYHHGKAEYDYLKIEDQYLNSVTGKMEDLFRMVDKNPDEHWYDSVGHQEHYNRIEEGLLLFGKYFRNLWD